MSRLLVQMRRDLRKLLQGEGSNRGDVTIVTNAADLAGVDPNLESTYPVPAPKSGTFPALIHFVQPTTSAVRQFAEVQVGDVIVDFAFDTGIPKQTAGAKFYIKGNSNTYVQKQIGKDLADAWELIIDGEQVFKTLLLTKQS